jgi:TRAP-type C4-dicarboxylate transport system permease small subunit
VTSHAEKTLSRRRERASSWSGRWSRLPARLHRAAELIAGAMFAVMFASFLVQIVTRYVLDDPLSWTIEVCSIAYVWIVFFASATIVTHRQHITFDILYHSVRASRRRVFAIVGTALLLAAFLMGLPETFGYIAFVARKYTTILHVRLDLVYVCFGVFMVGVIVAAGVRLWRLFGRNWRSAL